MGAGASRAKETPVDDGVAASPDAPTTPGASRARESLQGIQEQAGRAKESWGANLSKAKEGLGNLGSPSMPVFLPM